MTAAAQSPPRDGPSRRRASPREIGLVLAALVIHAMALDTTNNNADVKTTASGREAFDPDSYGKETFPKAVETLDKDAVALPTLLAALRKDQDGASEKYGKREGTSPYAFAASGTGVAGAAEGGLMQVNVPGVILNYVDTSLPEYYYYQYSEYYNTPLPVEEHDDVAAPHRHHQPRQIQSS